jgi:hypothetical protein
MTADRPSGPNLYWQFCTIRVAHLGMLCEPAFAALGPVFDRIAVRATAARYQLTLSWKNMSR